MQKACMILRPSPSRSSSTNPPQPVLSALFERGGGGGAGANQRDGAGGERVGKGEGVGGEEWWSEEYGVDPTKEDW